jgi:tetratricopeptide (TPR) repeat protein
MMEVYNQTRAVLERSPGHPRALSYQALVRLAMGQPEAAERMLRQALSTDPDLLEGYIHLSLVHVREGRIDEADADIKEAARRHPAQAGRLRALWAEMRAQAESAPSAGGESASAAGADPHADVPVPGTAAGADDRGSIAGSLELAPGLESAIGAGAVVFLTVRAPDATSGPPLAAKRLSASSFPLSFSIGSADSMMGAALPERVRVEARVDADGDPLTRDPGDPAAAVDDVRLGTKGLRLVLHAPAR